MAKKAKKVASEIDGEEDEAGGEAKGGGGKKKLIMIAGAALLVAGGGGVYFLTKKPAPPPVVVEAKKPVAFVEVGDILLNLASETPGEKPRFLRAKISLELKDALVAKDVQPLLPRVFDIFQVFLRELRPSDIEGSAGIHRLREELLRRVNIAVSPSKVDAVLFKELVLQ